jgi:hypothetical protein
MEKQGDEPETPREVLHWAYFLAEKDRRDFEAAVTAKDYRVDSESHLPESENPYGVCFGKVQECGEEVIDKSVLDLSKLAKRFQGDYDGWEAQVMSSDTPEGVKPN